MESIQYITFADSMHDFFSSRNEFLSDPELVRQFEKHLVEIMGERYKKINEFAVKNKLPTLQLKKNNQEKMFEAYFTNILKRTPLLVTKNNKGKCGDVLHFDRTPMEAKETCWNIGSDKNNRGLYTLENNEAKSEKITKLITKVLRAKRLLIVKDANKIQENLLCQKERSTLYNGAFDKFDTKTTSDKKKQTECYQPEFQSYSITKEEGELFHFDAIHAYPTDEGHVTWILGKHEQRVNTLQKVEGLSPSVATFANAIQNALSGPVENLRNDLLKASMKCVETIYGFTIMNETNSETSIRNFILGLLDLKRGGDFLTVKAAFAVLKNRDRPDSIRNALPFFLSNDQIPNIYAAALGVPTGLTNSLKQGTEGFDNYLALYDVMTDTPITDLRTATLQKSTVKKLSPILEISEPKVAAVAALATEKKPSEPKVAAVAALATEKKPSEPKVAAVAAVATEKKPSEPKIAEVAEVAAVAAVAAVATEKKPSEPKVAEVAEVAAVAAVATEKKPSKAKVAAVATKFAPAAEVIEPVTITKKKPTLRKKTITVANVVPTQIANFIKSPTPSVIAPKLSRSQTISRQTGGVTTTMLPRHTTILSKKLTRPFVATLHSPLPLKDQRSIMQRISRPNFELQKIQERLSSSDQRTSGSNQFFLDWRNPEKQWLDPIYSVATLAAWFPQHRSFYHLMRDVATVAPTMKISFFEYILLRFVMYHLPHYKPLRSIRSARSSRSTRSTSNFSSSKKI